MYQRFKKELLAEMEKRRDILVIRNSKPSIEPIFEVKDLNDKLYQKILDEFNSIAIQHVEKLIYDLCKKYEIDVKRTSADEPFDLKMSVKGEMSYVELKTSPSAMNADSYHKFIYNVQRCSCPVYLIYLIKDNYQSRNIIARYERTAYEKYNTDRFNVKIFEEFLLEQFGNIEFELFKKAMISYKDEMHQAVGYQVTEILNSHNLKILKNELEQEFLNFEYDRVISNKFQDLNRVNWEKIKNLFLGQKRYRVLLGNSNFATAFLTSEWLVKKYFSLPELDNTFIITGYLKSIEQLLWKIVFYVGQGRQIHGMTIESNNTQEIDTTLGSLEFFIANYENDDLFDEILGTSTHFVMRYLKKQLSMWRIKNRNGYFHKDVLKDREKINIVREETFLLYILILGSLSLDGDTIAMLES